jgi:hypothetical protein|tara:strand:- start:234 stop:395 length:162 start_codon:yes stop_codon:yes gene_type:complete
MKKKHKEKAATPEELEQVLIDLGIEAVPDDHPIYQESPMIVFTPKIPLKKNRK